MPECFLQDCLTAGRKTNSVLTWHCNKQSQNDVLILACSVNPIICRTFVHPLLFVSNLLLRGSYLNEHFDGQNLLCYNHKIDCLVECCHPSIWTSHHSWDVCICGLSHHHMSYIAWTFKHMSPWHCTVLFWHSMSVFLPISCLTWVSPFSSSIVVRM